MSTTTNIITDNIAIRIKEIIVEKLGLHSDQLTGNAAFVTDLGVDSLDVMELQIELEKEFNLTIPSEEAEKLTTVGSVIHYITQATTAH